MTSPTATFTTSELIDLRAAVDSYLDALEGGDGGDPADVLALKRLRELRAKVNRLYVGSTSA